MRIRRKQSPSTLRGLRSTLRCLTLTGGHATGDYKYIESMALAAVAAGADGLEIEVHDNPQCAWSDGAQCLKPEKFAETIANCRKVAAAIGREM